MIRNRKVFYAIGQGGFYSEKIFFNGESKTIVYDCGSLNTNKLIKEIGQSGLGTIDYLVISHFHRDHINGIEELKKNYKIINVVIPKIEPVDILFYLKNYPNKSDNEFRDLILNPSNFFKQANNGQNSHIITVDIGEEQTEGLRLNQLPKRITHSTNLPVLEYNNTPIWILRFYIDKITFNKVELDNNEIRLINSIKTINDYDKHLKDLKKIYKKISNRDINLTSMSMLSAPINNYWYYHKNNEVSLMNGDILLNNEEKISEFTNHYSDFNNNVFDFHIPHHGSHLNLKRPINEWNHKQGIINSGYENNYGHPSGIILRKFSDANINTKILTEYDNNYSKICFYEI